MLGKHRMIAEEQSEQSRKKIIANFLVEIGKINDSNLDEDINLLFDFESIELIEQDARKICLTELANALGIYNKSTKSKKVTLILQNIFKPLSVNEKVELITIRRFAPLLFLKSVQVDFPILETAYSSSDSIEETATACVIQAEQTIEMQDSVIDNFRNKIQDQLTLKNICIILKNTQNTDDKELLVKCEKMYVDAKLCYFRNFAIEKMSVHLKEAIDLLKNFNQPNTFEQEDCEELKKNIRENLQLAITVLNQHHDNIFLYSTDVVKNLFFKLEEIVLKCLFENLVAKEIVALNIQDAHFNVRAPTPVVPHQDQQLIDAVLQVNKITPTKTIESLDNDADLNEFQMDIDEEPISTPARTERIPHALSGLFFFNKQLIHFLFKIQNKESVYYSLLCISAARYFFSTEQFEYALILFSESYRSPSPEIRDEAKAMVERSLYHFFEMSEIEFQAESLFAALRKRSNLIKLQTLLALKDLTPSSQSTAISLQNRLVNLIQKKSNALGSLQPQPLKSVSPVLFSPGMSSHLHKVLSDDFLTLQQFIFACPSSQLVSCLIKEFFNANTNPLPCSYNTLHALLENVHSFVQFGLNNLDKIENPTKELVTAIYALPLKQESFSFNNFCLEYNLLSHFGMSLTQSSQTPQLHVTDQLRINFAALCSALALREYDTITIEFNRLSSDMHLSFFNIIKEQLVDSKQLKTLILSDIQLSHDTVHAFEIKNNTLVLQGETTSLKQTTLNAYFTQLKTNLFAGRPCTPMNDSSSLAASLPTENKVKRENAARF
ncbi:MAG: hypothetical protein P4M12_10845 [Gammaproteobacteria bacterium]|nr:hypothetical protein [Gammaproteobacteria bacterium]